jgi:hypothetical protein
VTALYQDAKRLALEYFAALESAPAEQARGVMQTYCDARVLFEGVHPFNECRGPEAIADAVWIPLKSSFHRLQRRQDIFIAGEGEVDGKIWVMSMGHLMGLFDAPWLGIPATRRLAMLRYAEFLQVVDGRIAAVGLFIDILDLMYQAGVYPLPPATGSHLVVPGPRTHDGIHLDPSNPMEGQATLALVDRMMDDLIALNHSGDDACPPAYLARCWVDDMVWYGPCGIGSTYTIERYQHQHQYPFRQALSDKVFNGHRARIAEGNYAGWYGWPNLSNTARGGFLGLPGGLRADMRVVDIYRREGEKLVENWVLIDIPWWLKQQGLDVLDRNRQLHDPTYWQH